MAMSTKGAPEAWGNLVRPLKLDDAGVGEQVTTPAGVPEMIGVVEVVNPPQWPGLILRLDKPAPAVAHLFAMPMGGQTMLPVRIYLYGKEAAPLAGQIEATWQRWLGERFGASAPGHNVIGGVARRTSCTMRDASSILLAWKGQLPMGNSASH